MNKLFKWLTATNLRETIKNHRLNSINWQILDFPGFFVFTNTNYENNYMKVFKKCLMVCTVLILLVRHKINLYCTSVLNEFYEHKYFNSNIFIVGGQVVVNVYRKGFTSTKSPSFNVPTVFVLQVYQYFYFFPVSCW